MRILGKDLYNVDIEARTVLEQREIQNDCTVTNAIISLREAAIGLENPTIGIDTHEDYDGYKASLYVIGKRAMTDAEYEIITADRRRQQEFQTKMEKVRREVYGS